MDWNACATRGSIETFGTALMVAVSRTCAAEIESRLLPFNEEERMLFDNRVALSLRRMSDDALNTIRPDGWTALTFAVRNLRISTLKAILTRLPGVELQFGDSDPLTISIVQAHTIGDADPLIAPKTDRALARALCAGGIAFMQDYHKKLSPAFALALPLLPNVVAAIVASFLQARGKS